MPSTAMALVCHCGSAFVTVDLLYQHATKYGHRHKCDCGHLCGSRGQMAQHHRAMLHDGPFRAIALESLKGMPGRSSANGEKSDADPLGRGQERNNVTAASTTTSHVCLCGETFGSNQLLQEHATQHGHRYKCSCGQLCGSKKHLTVHQSAVRHKGSWDYTTLADLQNYPGVNVVNTNFMIAPRPAEPQSEPLSCILCPDRTFNAQAHLDQHQEAKHPSQSFLCIFCPNRTFNARADLDQHQEAKHQNSTPDPAPSQLFLCIFCPNRTFNAQADLDQHTADKHAANPHMANPYTTKPPGNPQTASPYTADQHAAKERAECPTCLRVFYDRWKQGQSFHATEQLLTHQRGKNHCFCTQHKLAFRSVRAYIDHVAQDLNGQHGTPRYAGRREMKDTAVEKRVSDIVESYARVKSERDCAGRLHAREMAAEEGGAGCAKSDAPAKMAVEKVESEHVDHYAIGNTVAERGEPECAGALSSEVTAVEGEGESECASSHALLLEQVHNLEAALDELREQLKLGVQLRHPEDALDLESSVSSGETNASPPSNEEDSEDTTGPATPKREEYLECSEHDFVSEDAHQENIWLGWD